MVLMIRIIKFSGGIKLKPAESSKREEFIDISRGILLILVILGHSAALNTNIRDIIYWFHMPAFFIISGFVFKIPDKQQKISTWIKNLSIRYFVPYLSYYLIVCLLTKSISRIDVILFLYGGRMYAGVYWFISCLYLTIIIFAILVRNISKKYIISTILLLYIMGHMEALFYLPKNNDYLSWPIIYKFPLNIDVCLVSLFYFSIGYYFKDTIKTFLVEKSVNFFIILTLVCIVSILLNTMGLLDYKLNIKIGNYTHLILDIIIPVTFTLWTLFISKYLVKLIGSNVINYIGRNTLPIMYLHVPLNAVLQQYTHYGNLAFLLVGTIFPIFFIYVCNKNKILKLIFLGVVTKEETDFSSIKRYRGEYNER